MKLIAAGDCVRKSEPGQVYRGLIIEGSADEVADVAGRCLYQEVAVMRKRDVVERDRPPHQDAPQHARTVVP